MALESKVLNAFTVDVEDYFQVSAFDKILTRADWTAQPLRVEQNTRKVLDLLERHGVKGTFFILGWVAEHAPQVVAEIANRGHEIGAHSYDHRLVYDLTQAEFRADLKKTAQLIEAACGQRPRVYRAPTFSITKRSLWALDTLAQEGYVLDSSIFPVRHDRYGIPDFPRYPLVLPEPERKGMVEFPMTTWKTLGLKVPTAGGGYLRLFPEWLLRRGIEQANRSGHPGVLYIHPWELDPDQPRFAVGRLTRFRHYVGLARTEGRLERLLQRYRFGTITKAAREDLGEEADALNREKATP